MVKGQKRSKYLDEIDFNSDCETIERNQADLLQHVSTALARFAKSDPTKFVENLRKPNEEVDAATLQSKLDEVRHRSPGKQASLTT